MTTPSTIQLNATRLSTVATSTRKAHRADFGTVLKNGFLRVGLAAERGMRVAAPHLPTASLLSAAWAGPHAPGPVASEPMTASAGQPAAIRDVMDATTRMTEMNASYNLAYLELQQRIQADTRHFNLVSNVLKTKHDAAKNALNNIR